jgi:hypothetical protein
MWDKLCEVLMDFDFLQAKINALTDHRPRLGWRNQVVPML